MKRGVDLDIGKKKNEHSKQHEREQRQRGGNGDGEFSEHKVWLSHCVAKAEGTCIMITGEIQCVRRGLTLNNVLVWRKQKVILANEQIDVLE